MHVFGQWAQVTIPARVHFCWIGDALPWAYVFAILSAVERSELPEIVLHHTDALQDGEPLRALRRAPRVRLSRIDGLALLTQVGNLLGKGDLLFLLYRDLQMPVMKADILRAAILFSQGGIYLDLDTVTVASLVPLLDAKSFVGTEFIVWPPYVRQSRSAVVWARHLILDVIRKILRWLPGGWKWFRKLEALYVPSVNNAVMGAEPYARFFSDYLLAMIELPVEDRKAPYALGPYLLRNVADRQGQDLTIHQPQVFYPLSPEISEHWFRMGRQVSLGQALTSDTRIVHWYASVRTKPLVAKIDPSYVLANRRRQLYSALVYSCVAVEGLVADDSISSPYAVP